MTPSTPPIVVVDPDVMGGTPVLAGSRLPVVTLLGCFDAGDSWERIRESWPFLTPAHVEAARLYAESNDIGIRQWREREDRWSKHLKSKN
jgi:uncharacterized protein (DUF433 family)